MRGDVGGIDFETWCGVGDGCVSNNLEGGQGGG